MKTTILATVILLLAAAAYGQGVAINEDGAAPNASAMLEVTSTEKGVLIPRMTQAQRDVINEPAHGLLIYQSDETPGFYYNAGTPSVPDWQMVGSNAGTFSQWTGSGNNIYFNEGNVGIGLDNPQYQLHINVGLKAGEGRFGTMPQNMLGLGPDFYGGETGLFDIDADKLIAGKDYTTGVYQYGGTPGSPEGLFISSGNVGIGVQAPDQKLQVAGNAYFVNNDYPIAIGHDLVGGELGLIKVNKDLMIAGILNPGQTDLIYQFGGFSGSNEGLFIKSGNVGIGIQDPTHMLDIDGLVRIRKGGAGAGKVLTSDADGVASWETPEGSSKWSETGNNIYRDEGNVGIGTSSPSALLHTAGTATGDGNLLFEGEYKSDNPGDPPAEGAGTRMMWYPDKAAFRVGRVVGTQWDKDNIGDFSVAMGRNTTASGSYSMAMGRGTTASTLYSTAMGYETTASGWASTAMGYETTASGLSSTAMGRNTTASGSYSMAMGRGTTASTFYSTAMGYETTASGWSSTAMGRGTTASGLSSTAIGSRTTAPSFAETVVGLNNTDYTPNSTNLWISNDRLFVIGNGTSSTARSNAMTVLKNGNTGIGTDTPTALLHTHGPGQGEGNVVFTGVYKSSSVNQGDPPAEGAGTRMMWYPDKGAFRAGGVDGTEWNKNNIGNYSMALGYETIASGHYSTAMGRGTTASTLYSTAMGYETTASGQMSTAMGEGTTASGSSSTAMGLNTNAPSFAETAVGIHNTESPGASANSWQPNDRVFVIGVGSSSSDPRNAMTVLKNGNIALGTHTPHGNSLLSTWREGPGQAGVIFQGQVYENNPGDPPATHPGTRMMWYPDKAAFRAGEIWEDVWNKHTIGYHSVAFNFNTRASGNGSVAMGINTSAPSYGETAIGVYNTHYVPGSATERDDNDRLFVIGNGNLQAHSNALTLFKNGNMALGAHSAGNNRLRVVSSASGSGGATGYFENEHASGIALRAYTNSDDGTMLVTQRGDGYIMRLDGYDWQDNWYVAMVAKDEKVGIKTANPTRTLDVAGELRVRHTMLGHGQQTFSLYICEDGTLTRAGEGKSMKTNIKPIENSLQKVLQLRGVSFNWIENPDMGERIGMIAEEVEEILPQLVHTHEKDGSKGINHNQLNALLVEAIKEQQAIIEAQNQLNAEIYKELELLKSRMNALEALK